jgi:hypothetical protein
MMSRWWESSAAGLVGLLALVGCGTQTSGGDAAGAPTPSDSTTPSLTVVPDKPVKTVLLPPPPRKTLPVRPGQFSPEVVWRGDTLLVTAFGSSTCRPVATDAVTADQHTIVVVFADPSSRPGQACTDDYAPHLSRIPAPTGAVDFTDDVYAMFELEGAPRQLIPVQLDHPTPS